MGGLTRTGTKRRKAFPTEAKVLFSTSQSSGEAGNNMANVDRNQLTILCLTILSTKHIFSLLEFTLTVRRNEKKRGSLNKMEHTTQLGKRFLGSRQDGRFVTNFDRRF